jgi:hypothetical protein
MMIEALYGELGAAERGKFDAHLGACPDCAAEYSVLGAALRVMDERRRPDPGPGFWEGYWDRLETRMERQDRVEPERHPLAFRVRRLFSGLPRWSFQAAAAAALVTVGILIGRSLLSPPGGVSPDSTYGTSAALAVSNDPAVRAERYIDRSQTLLLGLVNYDPKTDDFYALDLPGKKAVSRELVTQAADIRTSLTDPRQKRLRELVSDLQVIMMQIANLGAGNDLEGVELVKQGVRQNGVFLKIDLTRMAAKANGLQAPPPRPGPGASGRPDKNKI